MASVQQPEMLVPELDSDCLLVLASYVDEADFKAFLCVSRTWLNAALTPTLPFWSVLDERRFKLLQGEEGHFCGCAVARALKRLSSILVAVDCAGMTHCGAATCGIDKLALALVRGVLPSAATPFPRLVSLRLDRPPDRPPVAEEHEPLRETIYLPRSPPARLLPALKVLSLSRDRTLCAPWLRIWLAAAPQLEELYCGDCPHLRDDGIRVLSSQPRPLRANLLDAQPLPREVTVACGLCGRVLWSRLSSYARAPPTQPHIDVEVYTNTPPDGATSPLAPGMGRCLNCSANCHAQHALYLIDAGTGDVELHGWRYGVAQGAGGRFVGAHEVPPLAVVAAAAPQPHAAASASGAAAPAGAAAVGAAGGAATA